MGLFERIVDENLLVRRLNIVACHVLPETDVAPVEMMQLDLFAPASDPAETEAARRREKRHFKGHESGRRSHRPGPEPADRRPQGISVMKLKNTHKYDDIMHLSRPASEGRARMSG